MNDPGLSAPTPFPRTPEAFYELIGLPGAVRERYLAWDRENRPLADPELVRGLLCRERWDEAVGKLQDRIGPDEDGIRILWEELRIALHRVPDWEKAGIPAEIFRDTMAFATRYLRDGAKAFGRFRFSAPRWFPRQLAMELFRLGTLEFERTAVGGERRIYVHVPTDASLAPEALDDSLARVRPFFARFFPEWGDAPVWCDSWLLSPALRKLLPPGSRILGFQDRFRVESTDPDNTGAVAWVFPGPEKPVRELPEDTSLRKSMKAFLLDGGKPGSATAQLLPGNAPPEVPPAFRAAEDAGPRR